jgi:hypothetical protein
MPFVLAEVVGAALAVAVVKVLYPETKTTGARVVVQHHEAASAD